jgi:hypothetical protein
MSWRAAIRVARNPSHDNPTLYKHLHTCSVHSSTHTLSHPSHSFQTNMAQKMMAGAAPTIDPNGGDIIAVGHVWATRSRVVPQPSSGATFLLGSIVMELQSSMTPGENLVMLGHVTVTSSTSFPPLRRCIGAPLQ